MLAALKKLWPTRRRLLAIEKRPIDEVTPRPAPERDRSVVWMDRQTFRDLEIFEADGEAASLFDLLNHTRTDGGSQVLHRRFRRPFTQVHRIRQVQDSLRYLVEHHAVFEALPVQTLMNGIDRYLHAGLPLLTTTNRLEFFLEALEVRYGQLRDYWRIAAGIQCTAMLLRALARIANHPGLPPAPGELGPWLEELRALVNRPAFAELPGEGEGEFSCWRMMRMDRLLRLGERETIERLIELVYEIDALFSMAVAMRRFGLVLPEVREGPLSLKGEGLFHPFLDSPVRNPVHVDQQRRLLFLTGPNMAGKTTYLRACGTAVYLAHLGMGVPARTFEFTPCDSLFSAISLTDNVREGVSFFRAEALRVKEIAAFVANGDRVVALLDEPFKGTNVKDALDASHAVLLRLAEKDDNVFLVSSHLMELGDALEAMGLVDCRRFEASENGGRLAFDFVLRPGVSSQRLGVRVLEEEGVFELLGDAVPASAVAVNVPPVDPTRAISAR